MARVPDTDTYALSDVITVVEPFSQGGTVSSVTNNGGIARFNVATTGTLAVGSWVVLYNLGGYDGTYVISALSANSYFECSPLAYTGDDSGGWKDLVGLGDCFADANSAYFDPLYEGSKDRLSNFRNYGWVGSIAAIETEDHGSGYRGVHGNTDWIFVAFDSGVISYDISESGYMIQKGSSDETDAQYEVCQDSVYGFVFSTDYYDSVKSWSVDAFGDLTRVTDLSTYSAYSPSAYKYPLYICTDNNKFVFVVNLEGGGSAGYVDIMVLEFNTSTGALTYKNKWSAAYLESITSIKYVGNYLVTAGSAGLRSFSVNQTTGELTAVDSGEGSAYDVSYDLDSYDDYYLFASSHTYGMVLFTIDQDTGAITYRYYAHATGSPDIGSVSAGQNGIVYGITTTGYIAVWRIASGLQIEFLGISSSSYTYVSGVHAPNPTGMDNSLAVVTRIDTGITSFETT